MQMEQYSQRLEAEAQQGDPLVEECCKAELARYFGHFEIPHAGGLLDTYAAIRWSIVFNISRLFLDRNFNLLVDCLMSALDMRVL